MLLGSNMLLGWWSSWGVTDMIKLNIQMILQGGQPTTRVREISRTLIQVSSFGYFMHLEDPIPHISPGL